MQRWAMAETQPNDPNTVTPKDLAKELGVSDRTLRGWLRAQGWQSVPHTRWHLSQEQADQVRARFKN